MKLRYHSYHGGGSHDAKLPFEGAKSVEVPGALCANADCDAGSEAGGTLRVAGVKGTESRGFDTVECEAGCLRCGMTIGRIEAKGSTIFGLEEDERVLNGRMRVY